MNLCQYRHIFGKENEGAHSYRIWNIAIVDLLLTIIGALGLSIYFKQPFWLIFVIIMIIGLVLHRLFCVRTTLTKMVFGNF
jgi:fatty acid desaturase